MTAATPRSGLKAPPAVIVVSSHVVRGAVGNRGAVFALETLGHPVWAIPTITLPWHPGHASGTRIVPDPERFSALLDDLARAPWLGEVGAVLTGYLGDAAQAESVAALVKAVRRANRNALYLCDPVIGDAGGLYVPVAVAEAIRDHLIPLADIASPNRFELEWLTQESLPAAASIVAAARRVGPPTMLVTSAPAAAPDRIANLLVTPSQALCAGHAAIADPPNGPGDLTAALLLARLVEGAKPAEALRAATASVRDVMQRAVDSVADELMLARDAAYLSNPEADVTVVPLDLPAPTQRA